MSLLLLDSLSRYGSTDGASALPFLNRYGWSSTGNVHNRNNASLFGANVLQMQGGGSGKSAFWGSLYRPITTSTFGLSFKGCAISNVGNGGEFWNNFLIIYFANGNHCLLMNRTYRTTSGSNNITTVDYVNSQLNGGWRNGFGVTSQVFSNVSTSTNLWTSTINILNWFHYDVLVNTASRTLVCRVITPNGVVSQATMISDLPISNMTGFYLGAINQNAAFLVSDVVLWTADSVGFSAFPNNPRGLRIQRITPSSNGTLNNWTPSSGTNVAAVSETPYSDAQFSAGVGSGTKQTFFMNSLGTSLNSVKGGIQAVQLNPNCIDAGGNASLLVPIQIIGGTETPMNSGIVPSRVTFANAPSIITTNPATGQRYTASQINNAEIGFNVQ